MNEYIKHTEGNLVRVDFFAARLDRPDNRIPQWLIDLELALEAL